MTRLLSSTLSSRAVSKADIETLVRSRHKSSLIVFYVRQPVSRDDFENAQQTRTCNLRTKQLVEGFF